MQQQKTPGYIIARREALRVNRAMRGAKAEHAQLRQEIADLAIVYCTEAGHGQYWRLQDKVKELRDLEQQYPHLKET